MTDRLVAIRHRPSLMHESSSTVWKADVCLK
jgi:hypothetical protein